jgi:AcrR family transcriptional regulator
MTLRPKKNALKPRKIATQTRATKTVEAIVEAAARILEKAGFEGYTTNAIAERAGVSIGSLYQYFPNKDVLTLALIERESATLLQEVEEAAANPEWRAALDGMVGAAVRHQLRRPALARLLDVEETRLPVDDKTVPASGSLYLAVRKVVAQAAPDDRMNIDILTADVIGITRGMTDMAGRTGETDAEDLSSRVGSAVLGYLTNSMNLAHRKMAR